MRQAVGRIARGPLPAYLETLASSRLCASSLTGAKLVRAS